MEKELPNKFRFKANEYHYLAELSTQADVYNISQTDSEGKDIRNLGNKVLKETVPVLIDSGHWKIIEEPFVLPKKFSFTAFGAEYTAEEQEDKSYEVWFESRLKYEYSRDIVEKHVKQGDWVIQKDKATEEKSEPAMFDDIAEFTNKTGSQVTIESCEAFHVYSGFLNQEFEVDGREELKQLMAAITTLWNIVNGK